MSRSVQTRPRTTDAASPRPEPLLGSRLAQLGRRHLPIVHFTVDASLWQLAIPIAVVLRYDFDLARMWQAEVFFAMSVATFLQASYGVLYGLYRRKWRYGSFDEVRIVALTALSVGATMTVAWWGIGSGAVRPVPRSVPLLATGVSLLGQIAIRSMWRLYVAHRNRPNGEDLQRLVLVGAGEGAEQILRTLRTSSDSPYVPVAMVDDDRRKRNLRMSGVKVEGTVDRLVAVATRHRATAVLIAAPSATSSFFRRVTSLAEQAGLSVYVLPPVDQLLPARRLNCCWKLPPSVDPPTRALVDTPS